jgi:serine/threonine-protein kinase
LHAQEAARISGLGRVFTLLTVVGLAFLFSLPVKAAWLQVTMAVTLVVVGLVSGWVWLRARTPVRYTKTVLRLFVVTSVLASLVVVYYGGVCSTPVVVVALGIGVLGLADDRRLVLGAGGVVVAGHLAMSSLIMFGVIPDLGLYSATAAPISARLFNLFIVPAVYLVTLWQARFSHRAIAGAIEQLDKALRLAHRRETQLQEANQQVDIAVQARAGRYTGNRVGAYVILEPIGRGAFGEVYAAYHAETGDRAAIKLLLPRALENSDFIRRFMREAEALLRFRAPNVVAVFDVGTAPGGEPFIAMEFLRGHSLAWHLRHRQLSTVEVLRLASQVATGLQAAHDAGIVHRDIKPQNLFLHQPLEMARENPVDGKPVWKILDFGVAKLGGDGETLTHGGVIGTPGYLSPEQAHGRAVDHRSDVFSLGAVVYRALSGRPPFPGNDMPRVIFEIAYRNPPPVTHLAPSLPREVDAVMAVALAKRPEQRFQTAIAFASALQAAFENGPKGNG